MSCTTTSAKGRVPESVAFAASLMILVFIMIFQIAPSPTPIGCWPGTASLCFVTRIGGHEFFHWTGPDRSQWQRLRSHPDFQITHRSALNVRDGKSGFNFTFRAHLRPESWCLALLVLCCGWIRLRKQCEEISFSHPHCFPSQGISMWISNDRDGCASNIVAG